jgi:hypothetical protein
MITLKSGCFVSAIVAQTTALNKYSCKKRQHIAEDGQMPYAAKNVASIHKKTVAPNQGNDRYHSTIQTHYVQSADKSNYRRQKIIDLLLPMY